MNFSKVKNFNTDNLDHSWLLDVSQVQLIGYKMTPITLRLCTVIFYSSEETLPQMFEEYVPKDRRHDDFDEIFRGTTNLAVK